MRTQKPCLDKLVISTSEVRFPRVADLIFVPPDQSQGRSDAPRVQSVILRQLDFRLQPELGFAIDMVDMNVYPRLFAREKEETEAAFSKNRGAHNEQNRDLAS